MSGPWVFRCNARFQRRTVFRLRLPHVENVDLLHVRITLRVLHAHARDVRVGRFGISADVPYAPVRTPTSAQQACAVCSFLRFRNDLQSVCKHFPKLPDASRFLAFVCFSA